MNWPQFTLGCSLTLAALMAIYKWELMELLAYFQPRVLDCLHSMCEDCIIAQLDGRRDGDSTRTGANAVATDFELEQNSVHLRPTPPGVIRCPICRQVSALRFC